MNAETDFLEQADANFAEALAEALDMREHETGDHSKRVACHTLVLARHFTTDSHHLRQIYWGALLHDIGKIGVPDDVLLKKGALNEAEWLEMRMHPEKGHRIVSQIPEMAEAPKSCTATRSVSTAAVIRAGCAANKSAWARGCLR